MVLSSVFNKDDKMGFELIKHHENEYRMPKILGITKKLGRKFGVGKGSTSHNSDRYSLVIPDIEVYQKNKDTLFTLFDKSAEMAVQHWDKRLNISYHDGRFSSATEFFEEEGEWSKEFPENSFPRAKELCLKYLDPDYTYNV